ncbi:hypothetical protein [Haliangium sp.]|uniref:hypothetical protein n=1 Tax=Haliangium sp. TaxID=2663208 RepID=UPI003D1360CF
MPPFSFHEVPLPRDMAKKLVSAVPESERDEASDLLVLRILPVKLAGIEQHSKPRRLSAVVYKELAKLLSSCPPNMRLHALRLHAVATEILRIGRESLSVAINRFLLHNTGNLDAEKLERWLNDSVQNLRMLSDEELVERARRLRFSLRAWKDQITADYPSEWQKHRLKYKQIESTLHAAETASFEAAAGSFLEFLRDADRDPDELTF